MHAGALALQNLFTEYVWPLTITNINCSGSEGRLLDCTYSTEPISTCYQRSDASVMCQGMLLIIIHTYEIAIVTDKQQLGAKTTTRPSLPSSYLQERINEG